MKFYLSLAGSGFCGKKASNTIRIAMMAEELGYDALLLPDHYMLPSTNRTYDTWVTLAYIAAKTEKIRVGSIVTPLTLRPPSILAKMVSTLDLLSGGRVILGVGAGWHQPEFEAYSQWNDAKTRVDKTVEGLELIVKLWTEDMVDFKGRFYAAKQAVLEPKPIQKPYPTLLFGTRGKRMLRLAGRYGNLCVYLKEAPQKMRIVHTSAERYGRKIGLAYGGTTLEDLKAAKQVGAECMIVDFFKDTNSSSYFQAMKSFAKNLIDKTS